MLCWYIGAMIWYVTSNTWVQKLAVLWWCSIIVVVSSCSTTLTSHVHLSLSNWILCVHQRWILSNILISLLTRYQFSTSTCAWYDRALLHKSWLHLRILLIVLILQALLLLLNQWKIVACLLLISSSSISWYFRIVFQLIRWFQNILSIFHNDVLLLLSILCRMVVLFSLLRRHYVLLMIGHLLVIEICILLLTIVWHIVQIHLINIRLTILCFLSSRVVLLLQYQLIVCLNLIIWSHHVLGGVSRLSHLMINDALWIMIVRIHWITHWIVSS